MARHQQFGGFGGGANMQQLMRQAQKLQEQMTTQIADDIMRHLDARGVMVVIEAEHLCMTMRGVKKPGAKTITTCVRGAFEEQAELRATVLSLIRQ